MYRYNLYNPKGKIELKDVTTRDLSKRYGMKINKVREDINNKLKFPDGCYARLAPKRLGDMTTDELMEDWDYYTQKFRRACGR